ncbi:MAG: hypothetical protein LUE86_13265 [Clostridiales bacterium]|nr:hypothetical protein [Clostridiales bacterium]
MTGRTIGVVLTALIQTGYEDYTHVFKTVDIEIPDDGVDCHVTGESYRGGESR